MNSRTEAPKDVKTLTPVVSFPDPAANSKTEFMPKRLTYEESIGALQKSGIIEAGTMPPLPRQPPRYDDAEPLGVNFFRSMLAEAKLEHLTLPRTYFSRTEIRACSFKDTDLSESVANWNDFIEVNFTAADLTRADLRASLFEQVRFRRARLIGADLRYCGFKKCDFTDADLSGAMITIKAGKALKLSSEQQAVIDWQADDGEEPPGG